MSKEDKINHPKHYTQHPSGVECITVTECFNFNIGNAIKYLWRAGLKDATLDDLKKARWYCDREIQRLEKMELLAKSLTKSAETINTVAGITAASLLIPVMKKYYREEKKKGRK